MATRRMRLGRVQVQEIYWKQSKFIYHIEGLSIRHDSSANSEDEDDIEDYRK